MNCGVRYCGGCNPRYDRGRALAEIQSRLSGKVVFSSAEEGKEYDLLLVIGGCTNCCAGYEQFTTKEGVLKMWDQSHVENIVKAIMDMDLSVKEDE